MESREQWGTRAGFVLAAIGSAIGLGNIWRFPAVAYENGGGAFFIPYLFALLTAGIPILILEFTLGRKYRGSAPLSMYRMNKRTEWLGWWQIAISFVISTYYAVIIAWAMSYAYFSFNLKWGDDTQGFLLSDYLQVVDAGKLGGLVPNVLIPLIIVWIISLFVMSRGVKRGIEIANRIMIPALVIVFLIITIRAITLDGAAAGLNAFFKPNWDSIFNGKVWVAAYGQIFFSLSIAFAIMVTYASYLPKKTDVNNNAFITAFSNSGFELLAGIAVFSILGFLAASQGVSVHEVVSGGIGLAFIAFPAIINTFPGLNEVFGVLFFLSLILAGLTSLISILETFIAGVQDKFQVSRRKSVLFGGGLAAIVSLLFATKGGLNFLDVVDYFINNFGIALAGLVEVVIIAWILRNLKGLQNDANEFSDLRIGVWWRICLGFITPLVLGWMMVDNIITNIKENYEGYPSSFLLSFGWIVAILVIVVGVLFTLKKWDQKTIELPTEVTEESSF